MRASTASILAYFIYMLDCGLQNDILIIYYTIQFAMFSLARYVTLLFFFSFLIYIFSFSFLFFGSLAVFFYTFSSKILGRWVKKALFCNQIAAAVHVFCLCFLFFFLQILQTDNVNVELCDEGKYYVH